MYSDRRVYINANDLSVGNTAKLTYTGELADVSEEIYVHLGYGLLWENVTEIKMSKANNQYFAYIPVMNADSLNFCFRNGNNQWDNNLGCNYSYEIKQPAFVAKAQQTVTEPATIISNVTLTQPKTAENLNDDVNLLVNTQETITSTEATNNIETVNTASDITVEIACNPITNITAKQAKEIDIEIACADEPTVNVTEEVYGQDIIDEETTQSENEDEEITPQKTYADLTAPIVIATKKSSENYSNKVKPWKTTQNYSEDDDVCLNIANIAINNSSSKTAKIACNSIDIENVHKISADNFRPNSTVSQITTGIIPNDTVEKYSSIPTNLSLAPIRKVSDDYLRKKKIKIALYRVFAYIPRIVTGNGKKNRNLWR